MIVSANELETLVTKAARGVGWPPALAAEAGRATVWLCHAGKDGLDAVLKALASNPTNIAAQRDNKKVRFKDARIIIAGPSIFDLLAIEPDAQIPISDVDSISLLLGYAGVAALHYDMTVCVATPAKNYTVSSAGITESESQNQSEQIVVTRVVEQKSDTNITGHTLTVDQNKWDHLTRLAIRSYVPSSESSRAKGAGAGLTDND